MSSSMISDLSQDFASRLNTLIAVNVDSREGYQDAAGLVDDGLLARKFWELGKAHSAQAGELQRLMLAHNLQPQYTGSPAGASHLAWINARQLANGSSKAIVLAAERAEQYVHAQYEELLSQAESPEVHEMLQRHVTAAESAYDMLHQLRESR